MRKRRPATTSKSNTWALIAAVLVATFSLLFNHLFRITPDKIDAVGVSWQTIKDASFELAAQIGVAETAADLPSGVRPPEQILEDLEHVKTVLDVYFAAYMRGQSGLDKKIEQAAAVVRQAVTGVEAQQQTLALEQLREARLAIFKNFFLIAEMRPQQYSNDFQAVAEQLLSDPLVNNREPIQLFLAYHRLGLQAADNDTVLERLEEFAEQETDVAFATQLYALVANVMNKYDRRHLGGLVLRQGMEIYAGHEERARLVNVLIDLKMKDLAETGS